MCDPLTHWMIVMPGARITYRSSNRKTKSQYEYIMASFTCSSTLHTCYTDICSSVQSPRPDLKDCGGLRGHKEKKQNVQRKKGVGNERRVGQKSCVSDHSEIHRKIYSLPTECFSSMTTSPHLVGDEELWWVWDWCSPHRQWQCVKHSEISQIRLRWKQHFFK